MIYIALYFLHKVGTLQNSFLCKLNQEVKGHGLWVTWKLIFPINISQLLWLIPKIRRGYSAKLFHYADIYKIGNRIFVVNSRFIYTTPRIAYLCYNRILSWRNVNKVLNTVTSNLGLQHHVKNILCEIWTLFIRWW